MRKLRGFTLLELLTVILIMSILMALAYPLYTQHLVETRRANAEAALLDLATKMESFYLAQGTYQNATLSELGVNTLTQDQAYRLDISAADPGWYKLIATPMLIQHDPLCASLSFTQTGEKGISGTGTISQCW